MDEKNAISHAVDTRKMDEDRKNMIIGQKIRELLTTLNDAKKIDCTCDKIAIAGGKPCVCIRAGAIHQASIELGKYLRKLRGELKNDKQ